MSSTCQRYGAARREFGSMAATYTFGDVTHTHERCPVLLFMRGMGPMPVDGLGPVPDGLDGRDDLDGIDPGGGP